MNTKSLNKAWILLIAFSLITTVLARMVPEAGPYFVAAVLVLSGLKARVILMDYLCLSQAPSFRGGFVAFLVAFLALAFGLYLIG